MNTPTTPFYHLDSKTMDACELDDHADSNALKKLVCPDCYELKRENIPIDVRLSERIIKDAPLNFVVDLLIGVARRGFLDIFGKEIVDRDLYIGKVLGPDGKQIDDWVTFRGRQPLMVRGSRHFGNRTCKVCGRNAYFAMGKRFIFPSPPIDATIFESNRRGLVIPSSLFERIDMTKYRRKFNIENLHIPTEPPDGFGILNYSENQKND